MADNVPVTPGTGAIIATDDVAGVQFQKVKITLGDDGVDGGLVSATNPLPITGAVITGDLTDAQLRATPVPISATGVVSATNSTTAVLGVGALFTGTAIDTLLYSLVSIGVIASHASATDGLSIQQSSDGTNWDSADVFTVPAATGKIFNVNPSLRFLRVVYTNGATLQTFFRLQTILRFSPFTRGSAQRPQDARTNDNDYDETLSYPSCYNGTTWDRMRGDITNGLDVDVTRLPSLVAGGATIGGTYPSGGSAVAQGNPPVATTVAASNVVLKGTPGNLYSVNICTGGTAGYLMLFNATTAPADGTVTPTKVMPVAANAGLILSFSPAVRFSVGCTAVFSTTGPFTKTASATAFICGECL